MVRTLDYGSPKIDHSESQFYGESAKYNEQLDF